MTLSRAAPDSTQEVLVAGLTPYFLDKGVLWFQENLAKIKKAAQTQIWWKTNTLWLEKDLQINLFALLRQLTELGYAKTQTLGAPGEFSHRGGIVEIFPINSDNAWQLEFVGKKIAAIEPLAVKILRTQKQIKKDLSSRQNNSLLFGLRIGDCLVHLDHGVGRFAGFTDKPGNKIFPELPTPNRIEVPGTDFEKTSWETKNYRPRQGRNPAPKALTLGTNEAFWCGAAAKYFTLHYAKGDKLFVPLDKENKLSHYIGFEAPIIHRLGGSLWLKTKHRAKENTLELAKELLSLYGQRAASRGFQYPVASQWEKELAADFPYIETDDQARAINEVMHDMESSKPMDRLICGDVGFGKTEVALRSAFKAAEAGKQVAMLAPTTILANQHFRNFTQRLGKFPVRLALLTRLQSKSQQKKIIKELNEGKVDILIGTHRLLSKDVHFKNLGLAIIDEEQRFGVKQKEKFKIWRNETMSRGGSTAGKEFYETALRESRSDFYGVDVLSLSATPIPRTLNLTLAGLRDISIISTPPPGRLPIKTFVEPFNKKIVADAITKELIRNGQVYYLHNRVETIALATQKIQKLFPRAKIAYIHGRLPEKDLIKIMDDFDAGKISLLVATTIIENGLDFPNVNALIVANATRLGLAQAYQLRGRIGRSHQQAYAYFLYNAKHLTDDSAERLKALQENEALGSGYQIALRDLEIRGAGNVLGREQSGPVNSVGLNLYMQMLNESIEEMKSDNLAEEE